MTTMLMGSRNSKGTGDLVSSGGGSMRRNRRGVASRFAALALIVPVLGGCASRTDRIAAGDPSAAGAAPATLTGATLLTDGEMPRLLLTGNGPLAPTLYNREGSTKVVVDVANAVRVARPRAPARGRRDSLAPRHEVVHGDGQAPHPVRAHGARRRSRPPSPPSPARRPWRSRSERPPPRPRRRRRGPACREPAVGAWPRREPSERRRRPRAAVRAPARARREGRGRLRARLGRRGARPVSPPARTPRRCPSGTPPLGRAATRLSAVSVQIGRTAGSSRRSPATAASRTRRSRSRIRRATSWISRAFSSRRRRSAQDVKHAAVSRVRVSQFKGGSEPVTRVVFDLASPAEPAAKSRALGARALVSERLSPAAPRTPPLALRPRVSALPAVRRRSQGPRAEARARARGARDGRRRAAGAGRRRPTRSTRSTSRKSRS